MQIVIFLLVAVACLVIAGLVLAREQRQCGDSSVWVLACEEKKCTAIVELVRTSGRGVVRDCSLWREGSQCGRSCARYGRTEHGELRPKVSQNCY
jgi:hypothetical protein